jgi:hypothetical protein
MMPLKRFTILFYRGLERKQIFMDDVDRNRFAAPFSAVTKKTLTPLEKRCGWESTLRSGAAIAPPMSDEFFCGNESGIERARSKGR